MQPQSAVHDGLPGIDARPVGAVVVWLEPPAGQQLGVGDQEVQLQTPLVGVLHPQNAVLIFIESGHQNPLEAGHQFFPLAGRQIGLRKRQDAGGVFLHVRRRVNQLPTSSGFPEGRWHLHAAGLYPADSPPDRRHRRDRADEI